MVQKGAFFPKRPSCPFFLVGGALRMIFFLFFFRENCTEGLQPLSGWLFERRERKKRRRRRRRRKTITEWFCYKKFGGSNFVWDEIAGLGRLLGGLYGIRDSENTANQQHALIISTYLRLSLAIFGIQHIF